MVVVQRHIVEFVLGLSCLALMACNNEPSTEQQQDAHPRLAWLPAEVQNIQSNLGEVPLYDQSLADVVAIMDAEMKQPIEVPIPKDMSGGYTHERHKQNWYALYHGGMLYQITEDEKYAVFVRDMLLKYAQLYPELPRHPTNRSYATGKLFWQCLNDANWLVYASQAYDNIYNWLSKEEREIVEDQLFRPFADFLSIGNPQFFNRVHNHGTWANVAVGMIALAMDDEELLDRALYGLDPELIPAGMRDDDTGLIRGEGEKSAGFFAQLDGAFSPDGYFSEGPYYLRYAIFPYLVFSQALANSRADLSILSYRDSILHKAVYGLLNQADDRGCFFPINDALKGMSWQAREVVTAVDMAYYHYEQDPRLLSVAQKQGRVLLNASGFNVALGLEKGLAKPFEPKSKNFVDGVEGKSGGLAVLRSLRKTDGQMCLAFKYTEQGMGHGHFDKLSYSYYDEDGEVIQDYGAARWVNIGQKGGGRYLPENQTWAKQSIAHNTVVLDEQSHFGGDIRVGEKYHPHLVYFDAHRPEIQVVSALDSNAYPGHLLRRTLALVRLPQVDQPLLIDLFRVAGSVSSQIDLPIWFQGQLLETDFELVTPSSDLPVLGDAHGYQHLYREASGAGTGQSVQLSWLERGEFYTLTTLTESTDELHFLRLGANDPNFNLRRDPAFMIRKPSTSQAVLLSVLEAHGSYSPVDETPHSPYGRVSGISLLLDNDEYTVFDIEVEGQSIATLAFSHIETESTTTHELTLNEYQLSWSGPFALQLNQTTYDEQK